MKMMQTLQTWLLITVMALSANTQVSAKVASGGINLGSELHQGLADSKSLNALGISGFSTIDASGSPLVPNGGRNGSVDYVKNKGMFGGKFATTKQIKSAERELRGYGIKLKLNYKEQGGKFDFGDDLLVTLRRRPTQIQLFHEMTHVRQFNQLGQKAYIAQGRYARESHVFNQIWKTRRNYNNAEIRDAIGYMRELRYSYRMGRIR